MVSNKLSYILFKVIPPLRGGDGGGTPCSPAFSFCGRKKKKLRQKEKSLPIVFLLFIMLVACSAKEPIIANEDNVINGDQRIDYYLPYLKNKRVAIVANHTSVIDSVNIVDTLTTLGVNIQAIFSPEHGFRGHADAGEKVADDTYNGIKVYSLYGKNQKPTPEQLSGIDVLLYDLQDVGVRFFTYISTLHYVMQACADAGVTFIVLDRPNPQGNQIDGPVLQKDCQSFVGLDPIPILYGLTVGELACMISGENWIHSTKRLDLKVVEMIGYDPTHRHRLKVSPSPNLRSNEAIYLYPSLCLFEATNISVGRGTPDPFTVIGAPNEIYGNYSFIPEPDFGDKNPLHNGETCYGINLKTQADSAFTLKYIIDFYQKSPDNFYKNEKFFDLLAGTKTLRQQIINNIPEDSIRQSWQPELEKYKQTRQKYLLYIDTTSASDVSVLNPYEPIDWNRLMYSPLVDSLLEQMTLDEKIAQLIWVTLNGWPGQKDYDWVEQQCTENNVGGVLIMQSDNCRDISNFIQHLQQNTKYPLLFAMDAETGAGRKLSDVRNFPLNKYLASCDSATTVHIGQLYAQQLRTLGITINFAPVADVNTNPKNPIIGTRSFGADPQVVADHCQWLVHGMQSQGVVATIKHFPGHGDTHTDSHTTLPVITNDLNHIQNIDLLPFSQCIDAGTMAVMTAHIAVPALDPSGKVASLSPTMINLLRDSLHFEGLIVSDAMNMAGVKMSAKGKNVEAEALIAGNDVVEFCLDVPSAIKAVKQAILDGRLTEENLNTKVRRVLAVKQWSRAFEPQTLFGTPEVKLNSMEVETTLDNLKQN